MAKKVYKVTGMNCSSCATLLECELEDVGINAKCSWAKQTLEVDTNENKSFNDKLYSAVKKAGYGLTE